MAAIRTFSNDNSGIIPFILPIHPFAIALFLIAMMIYNVYGHLGFELYPRGFSRSVFGKWINTSVNHNQHHAHFKGNYGLYFLWWDRIMGTLRKDYDHEFDQFAN
jgi:lathosterol oxidase